MKYFETEILLVEDNLHEAKLTILSLKEHSFANKLIHVTDGAEALDFIFSKRKYEERPAADIPKLILLDLHLPKINGFQVLKEVKNNRLTKAIPVIILTSSQEDRDIVEGYELGANSYIVKPVEFESFAKAVYEVGLYWLHLNQKPIRVFS